MKIIKWLIERDVDGYPNFCGLLVTIVGVFVFAVTIILILHHVRVV